jgi:hypothetical protein
MRRLILAKAQRRKAEKSRKSEKVSDRRACSLSFARRLTILKPAIQAAPRPRKGIIPPELLGNTKHQLHFSLS